MMEVISRKHKYVIGIDFGHAETSACMCEIEWDKPVDIQDQRIIDLELDHSGKKKVVISAISISSNGRVYIGDAAIRNTDNSSFRIGFKKQPEDEFGEQESLMTSFMSIVYKERIRAFYHELTDDNHVVYIARPSGWNDQRTKDIYTRMALNAGIPLAGLSSESRSAIFYSYSNPKFGFSQNLRKGAMIFDLGSSTLDLTYIAEDIKPIDAGDNLGASIVDKCVFESKFLSNTIVSALLEEHPEYKDRFLYQARLVKETVYSNPSDFVFTRPFLMEEIIGRSTVVPEELLNQVFLVKIKGSEELNEIISRGQSYQKKLSDFVTSFVQVVTEKCKQVGHGYSCNGAILAGGASRMNFLVKEVSAALNIPQSLVQVEREPSMTVSRGIAYLGMKDGMTNVLCSELINDLPNKIKPLDTPNLISRYANRVSESLYEIIESTSAEWVEKGKTCGEDEIKQMIEERLGKEWVNMQHDFILSFILDIIETHAKSVVNEIDNVLSAYEPNISVKVCVTKDDITKEDEEFIASALSEVNRYISGANLDGLSLGRILRDIIFGVFILIRAIFESDHTDRERTYTRIKKNKETIKKEIKWKICEILVEKGTMQSVSDRISSILKNNLLTKLNQVSIPLE